MSHELFYTSAARGLRAGTSGFCTVAATIGLGPAWQQRLEAISGYKPFYPVGHPQAGANPVAYAHTLITVAGQTRSVFTRAAFAGADHTGRSNKFVHHLLPTDHERAPGGPAAVLRQPGIMADTFTGDPRLLTTGRPVPSINPAPAPADTWRNVTGDPAWAAALANVAAANPAAIVYVLYAPGTDVLALFDEALRLLPEPQRWAVTFNTYVTEPPATPCAWRGLIAGTPPAAMAKGTVIDLTNLDAANVPSGILAEAARSGEPAQLQPASVTDPSSNVRLVGANNATPTSLPSQLKLLATPVQRPAVPSNIRMPKMNSGSSKIKLTIIVCVAVASLICVSALGVGLWLMTTSKEAHQTEKDLYTIKPTIPLPATTSAPPLVSNPSQPPALIQPASQPASRPASQPETQPSQPTSKPATPPTTGPSHPPVTQPSTQPANDSSAHPASQPATQREISSQPSADARLRFKTGAGVKKIYWNIKNDPAIQLPMLNVNIFEMSHNKNWESDLDRKRPKKSVKVRHRESPIGSIPEAGNLGTLQFYVTIDEQNELQCDLSAQNKQFIVNHKAEAERLDNKISQINNNSAQLSETLSLHMRGIVIRLVAENKGAMVLCLTENHPTGEVYVNGED